MSSDSTRQVADSRQAFTTTENSFQNEHPWNKRHPQKNSNQSNTEQSARVQIALQAVVPENKEEIRAQKLIVKGEQDELKAQQLLAQAQKESEPSGRRDSIRAAKANQKANTEINNACATIEASSGYVLDFHNGHVSKVYKALPVAQKDIDRIQHEAEMRDPFGERASRTIGKSSQSTADFLKGACYGAAYWPDIAEYKTSDKKTARQWGYMAGGGVVGLAPVSWLSTITKGGGFLAHCAHGMHQYLNEKAEKGPDLADIARRKAELHDPMNVRTERTLQRVGHSIADYSKAILYGGLNLPDKGEIPPDSKPTERQLGYGTGDILVTSLPIPYASMGASIFGGAYRCMEHAHERAVARREQRLEEQKLQVQQHQLAVAHKQLRHNHPQPQREQNQG